MAYVSCAAKIAASIQQDCNKPLVGGYTGRAVIMSATDFERAEVVRSATNPRKILSVVLPPDGSVMAYTVDNVFAAPFTGSTTAGNTDNGRNGYLKTLRVRVPMRGADTSMKVIEPLVKSADGFVVISEKLDKVGDGSYEVIGYQNALRGDIAGVTRDESANGGDWIVPLTTVEKWAEVTLVGAGKNYETAKKNFEELLYFEAEIMTFVSEKDDESVILSANGLVYIDSVKNGENVRQVLSSPNNLIVSISNDADTDIAIYGAVYDFKAMNYTNAKISSINTSGNNALKRLEIQNNTGLTSLDTSKNTELTYLYCYSCTGLTSIDVSKNTALTYLYCSNCQNLLMLNIKNTAELMDDIILDQSMANLTTLQVAGTSAWAYEQVESWLSDYAPDGGKIYVDENTPQGVITEAEGKSWEVVYVS